jgi:hypothetical protein
MRAVNVVLKLNADASDWWRDHMGQKLHLLYFSEMKLQNDSLSMTSWSLLFNITSSTLPSGIIEN